MRDLPKENEIYRHFKGNDYQIVALAENSETGEELVIYRALYGEGKVYARNLEMFMSLVDKDKYPDAEQTYRFEKEELAVDPMVMEFLDEKSPLGKMKILQKLTPRITDRMIDTMAISLDLVIKEGPVEQRVEELKNCLQTLDKYETMRFR